MKKLCHYISEYMGVLVLLLSPGYTTRRKHNTKVTKMKRKLSQWAVAAILTVCGTAAFASCTANGGNLSGQAVESRYVPQAPDYSDPTMQTNKSNFFIRFVLVLGNNDKLRCYRFCCKDTKKTFTLSFCPIE
jgi:hypothetical protein